MLIKFTETKRFFFRSNQKEAGTSALSEPDELTQINSTKMDKSKEMNRKTDESTINERSFDSTYDDSFYLRTKEPNLAAESGFQSGNNTFDFNEVDDVSPTGIHDLMQREAKGDYGGGFFGKKTFFDFKILEKKV